MTVQPVVLHPNASHTLHGIPHDWDAIDASNAFPFAVDQQGNTVEYDPKVDPHLLVVGSSGSGKSVILQNLAYASIVRDCQLFIADPTKGAADFKFATPYATAVASDLVGTYRMLDGLYRDLVARKNLNNENGVKHYLELPEDIRPKRVVVVIDEFESLMFLYQVPPMTDDPDTELERMDIISSNNLKNSIVALVARIVREGRSAGITMMLSAQSASSDFTRHFGGSDIKLNTTKIVAGVASQGTLFSLLRNPMSIPHGSPAGSAVFESNVSTSIVRAWYGSGQDTLAQKLDERYDPLEASQKVSLYRDAPKQPQASTLRVVDFSKAEFSLVDFEKKVSESITSHSIAKRDVLTLDELAYLCHELNTYGQVGAAVTKSMSGSLYELNQTHPGYLALLHNTLLGGRPEDVSLLNLVSRFSDSLKAPSRRKPWRSLSAIFTYLTVSGLPAKEGEYGNPVDGLMLAKSWSVVDTLNSMGEGYVFNEDEVKAALLISEVVSPTDVEGKDIRYVLNNMDLVTERAQGIIDRLGSRIVAQYPEDMYEMVLGAGAGDRDYLGEGFEFLSVYQMVQKAITSGYPYTRSNSPLGRARVVWTVMPPEGAAGLTHGSFSGALILANAAQNDSDPLTPDEIRFFTPHLESITKLLPELRKRGEYGTGIVKTLLVNPATALREGEL